MAVIERPGVQVLLGSLCSRDSMVKPCGDFFVIVVIINTYFLFSFVCVIYAVRFIRACIAATKRDSM